MSKPIIDYILTPRRFKSSIKQTCTIIYPGADMPCDHDLVICNMKLKLKPIRTPQTKRIRFELSKLKNTSKLYRVVLQMQLEKFNISECDYNCYNCLYNSGNTY